MLVDSEVLISMGWIQIKSLSGDEQVFGIGCFKNYYALRHQHSVSFFEQLNEIVGSKMFN